MARNGERGEKAEEREMIEELLLPPTPPAPPHGFFPTFFSHMLSYYPGTDRPY